MPWLNPNSAATVPQHAMSQGRFGPVAGALTRLPCQPDQSAGAGATSARANRYGVGVTRDRLQRQSQHSLTTMRTMVLEQPPTLINTSPRQRPAKDGWHAPTARHAAANGESKQRRSC